MTMEPPTMQPLPITAIHDCSPFGLFCRDCKVPLASNKSAQNHLQSHHRGAIISKNRVDVYNIFKELRENGNTMSLDEWLVDDPKNGGECLVCRECILLKRNFKRHQEKNEGCASASCNVRMFRRTCCFRSVPVYDDQQSTILSLSTGTTAFATA